MTVRFLLLYPSPFRSDDAVGWPLARLFARARVTAAYWAMRTTGSSTKRRWRHVTGVLGSSGYVRQAGRGEGPGSCGGLQAGGEDRRRGNRAWRTLWGDLLLVVGVMP